MDLTALLERYQTLLPWNLARTKCFVSMILGMISSGSVQQHKTALGFTGAAKQKSVCTRISNFLKTFNLDFSDYAIAILEMAGLKGQIQKSPKAFWIGSSDFRHTQYAFPKKGNAVLKKLYFLSFNHQTVTVTK